MSVGVLIVTHEQIGTAIVDTAVRMLGRCPLALELLAVPDDSDPDALVARAQELLADLEEGEGVLILTDMFGSTPSNIACRMRGAQVRVVAGINLPMLVRVLNYPHLSLAELAHKALSGGRDGVVECPRRGSAPT